MYKAPRFEGEIAKHGSYYGRSLRVKLQNLILLLALGCLLRAQDHGSITGNPFSTPRDVAACAASFRSQCAACHGAEAGGGTVAPSLVTGTFKRGGSDEALYGVIIKGVPGTPMVGFKLNGTEVWQLISYLRSVNIAKAAGQAPGDAAAGARVYETNRCTNCHTIGATGGYAGPDLSEIGSRRSLQQIESSILEPDAEVAPDYWSLKARTKSGQDVTGRRMNEDMDSIQIRNPQGQLRSLRKSDLASSEIVRKSPMPSLKGKLNAADLQNLIAYLASQRAIEAEGTK